MDCITVMVSPPRHSPHYCSIICSVGVLLLLSGCASSLGTSGYELDVEKCYQSGGMVLTDHNTEVSRCIY
jgi:hypothetical protein